MRALPQVAEEDTGKVGVHTLVTADELIRKSKTGHQAALLQPEDGRKGAREENTLDSGKGNKTFSKSRTLVCDPLQGPVGLLLDAWDGLDGVEEVFALSGVLDVGVDEEGVGLGVNVFPG